MPHSAISCCMHFHQGAGDFGWAIHAAQRLLSGQNPYDTPLEQYPLTAAVFALPFVALRPEVAGALFYGISSALLAFGLTRHGYHYLFVFLAYPYWGGLMAVQWSTLIFASAFFPLLLPATMAKPQLGLPVALTRLSRRGVIACVAVLLLTLFALPNWPMLWLGQLKNYEHFFPLLVLPGPLLALALWRYRDKDAWFLRAHRDHASALVLRHFYPVAHSQVTPRDSFHRRPELGRRRLALVSHTA